MSKKVVLMILDGWGKGLDPEVSAIARANTPFVDSLYTKYPNSELDTFGSAVGLPEGQMGNSEVGHMNIGAGRVVYQMLLRINRAIADQSFHKNQALNDMLDSAKAKNQKVHLVGLVSDGGVHSHIDHLKAITEVAHSKGLEQVFIHAFTDGRDTDPKEGKGFLQELQNHLQVTTGEIATVSGRYFGMDRDKRWQQRIKPAYDALVHGKGEHTTDLMAAIDRKYATSETDEFIKPIILTKHEKPVATIGDGDMVICFNFRTDRLRELTEVLSQKDMPEEGFSTKKLDFATMTRYDEHFKGIKVLFEANNLTNTLGEALANAGKKQFRLAESIKYPHVTFFFSGGREDVFDGEERHMCPTPKVETFDLMPEMAAACIRDKAVDVLTEREIDFMVLNFANPDMVGHTGNIEAAAKACEVVDACAKDVAAAASKNGYEVIMIADHGNADKMRNPDGSPNTEHTLNPVPCILISERMKNAKIHNGKLADLAPTILHMMGAAIPAEMNGNILVEDA